MSIGISAFIHMRDGDKAEPPEDINDCFSLRSGGGDRYNTVHIFLTEPDRYRRGKMAAAAINGDWAEVRRLLDHETEERT